MATRHPALPTCFTSIAPAFMPGFATGMNMAWKESRKATAADGPAHLPRSNASNFPTLSKVVRWLTVSIRGSGPRRSWPASFRKSLAWITIRAMCGNSSIAWAVRCSDPLLAWCKPTPRRRTSGSAPPIPIKKNRASRRGDNRLCGRSLLSSVSDPASDMGATQLPPGNPHSWRTQHPEDSGRRQSARSPVRLPASDRVFQPLDLSGFCSGGGSADLLPSWSADLSHPGQCLLSHPPGGLGLVSKGATALGSLSAAQILARTQRAGAALALHSQGGHPQSVL